MLFRVLFLLFFCFLFFPKSVSADVSKFAVTQDVTYKVSEDGSAKVIKNLHIKNLTTESLAKEFVLKLKGSEISNIEAFDSTGQLPITQFKTNGGFEIRVQFGKLAPGKDKTLHWTLQYDTNGVAKKIGRLWKVSIPQISRVSSSDEVSVGLYVPSSFGSQLLAKPQPNVNANIWTGSSAAKQIIAVFGPKTKTPYQAYSFNLNYDLENKDSQSKTLEIALPPDTNYQKAFFESITPKPDTTKIDNDGNYLAGYNLDSKEHINITAIGNIAVFARPLNLAVNQTTPLLLKSDTFWEKDDPTVTKVASKLDSPEDIYNFTVSSLSYNKSIEASPKRLGAVETLKNRLSAICTEFTDVFIALTRSKNIPSREIDGFAYTEDQASFPTQSKGDVLHAWPEFFNKTTYSWQMVDPTWGKTSGGIDYFHSFDFDHVALAIKGEDSEQPQAAGFYKKQEKLKKFITSDQPPKDVNIYPVDRDLPVEDKANLDLSVPKALTVLESLPIHTKATVFNNSKITSQVDTIKVAGSEIQTSKIPPYGQKTITFAFSPQVLPKNGQLIYRVGSNQQAQNVKIIPFGSAQWFLSLPRYFLKV